MTGSPEQSNGRAEGSQPGGVALEALWHEHRRWVAAVLIAHMPARAELEYLLQEVAVTVVARVHELRDPAALRPWLRSVALNVARMDARGRRRRGGLDRPSTESDIEPPDPVGSEPHEQLARRAEAERVLAALAELPADYREVLALRCVQGLSQRDIAAALALPETTIETRLARGRRLLRERLGAAPTPAPRRIARSTS